MPPSTALAFSPQVEFNKAALSLADAFPADQKKAALNRLLKVGAGAGGPGAAPLLPTT